MAPLRSSRSSVTVSVPATTANIGPGFDAFGIALGLQNSITISLAISSADHPGIVSDAAASFFSGAGLSPVDFSWKIAGNVPRSRGLGSSVTVRLGILMGLNILAGAPLSRAGIFRLCAELEGHPDNAAPAIMGGFTISRAERESIRYSVAPGLRFVLLIPGFEVATSEARKVMPKVIPLADAAANAADAAVIATAFATRNYDLLRGSFDDRLHQPFRTPLVPFLHDVIRAGEDAGAIGGWLSGSGSTICCLAESETVAKKVSAAMKRAAVSGCQTVITPADNKGAVILKS